MLRRARSKGIVDMPAPGVLTFNGSQATWRQRLAVAVRTGGGDVVVSCRSAAELHQLDGFRDGVVEITGASRTKVYEALKRGELKAVKFGRATLVLDASVRRWLANLPRYVA